MSSLESQVRITGDHGFGRLRLQLGADYQGRYGLEARDTTVGYTLAGTIASVQTNPSIEAAHRSGLGVFGQAGAQVTPRLSLSGGLRADTVRNTNVGGFFGDRRANSSALAGLGSATFAVTSRTMLTAQIARGFRDPTLSDRFFRGPVGRGFIEGNPDLQPETSRQLDVTGRWEDGRLRLSGAYYAYRIANLVERYVVGTSNFFFRNRGAARLRGVEAEAQVRLPSGWIVDLSGQLSRGKDASDGTPIDDVAPDSIAAVLRHSNGRLTSYLRTAAMARHDSAGPSEVPTPGFVLLDGGAVWHHSRHVEVRGLVRNLLDARAYASTSPRWVYASGRNGSLTFVLSF
jgi:outer membrane receptor protein involved in Fe transport